MIEKNLPQDKQRTVTLSADVAEMLDAYAKAEGISRDLAARQLIRDGLEGMAAVGCLPKLKGKAGKMLAAVARAGKAGLPSDRLLDMLYADDADGGPLCAQRSMHALIRNSNRRYLMNAGYKVQGERTGRGAPGSYRLVKLEVPA